MIEPSWQCTSVGTSRSICIHNFLDRNITAVSTAGVATPVATVTAAAVGAGAVTGTAPVAAYLVLEQCQNVQIMTLFNMNTPEDYVGFSKSFGVTKMDLFMGDFTGAQDGRESGTRRALSSGYIPLYNVGYKSANFIINYLYFFILFGILGVSHLVLIIVLSSTSAGTSVKCTGRCLRAIRSAFEFYVYLYLLFFASLFIFLLTLNDMMVADFSTTLSRISFFVSAAFFILLVVLIFLPFFMMWRKRCVRIALIRQEEDNNEVQRQEGDPENIIENLEKTEQH